MELEKYIDKRKALDYVIKEAMKQDISLNELSKGVYDSSNFYKMCNGKYNREINFEKFCAFSNCLYFINSKAVSNSVKPHFSAKNSLTPPFAISRFVCAEYI